MKDLPNDVAQVFFAGCCIALACQVKAMQIVFSPFTRR